MQISEYQIFIKQHSLQFHRICDSTGQILLQYFFFSRLIDNFQLFLKKFSGCKDTLMMSYCAKKNVSGVFLMQNASCDWSLFWSFPF